VAYPAARRQRVLYSTAKRVVDEGGKGQEMLRTSNPVKVTLINGEVRATCLVPTVPIRIVDVRFLGDLVAGLDDINLIVPATYAEAPAAGNRLITEIIVAPADDTVEYGAVLPLAYRVGAEQPVILVVDGNGVFAGTVECTFDYILADDERTY